MAEGARAVGCGRAGRGVIRAFLAGAALALAAPVAAQANDPVALPAAERLIEAMNLSKQLDMAFSAMAPMMAKNVIAQLEAGQTTRAHYEAMVGGSFARKQRLEAILGEEYLAGMRAQLPRLKAEYAREYATMFTAAEMDELTSFFAKGAGAKFVAAMPTMQERLSGASQRIGIEVGMVATPKALQRAQDEFEAETKK